MGRCSRTHPPHDRGTRRSDNFSHAVLRWGGDREPIWFPFLTQKHITFDDEGNPFWDRVSSFTVRPLHTLQFSRISP